MTSAGPPPLSVLIGADSLVLQRSGIGRMTLEIVRAARQADGIGRVELLLGEALASASVLDGLDGDAIGLALGQPPRIRPWRVAIGRLPGVQALRRLKHGGIRRKVRRLAREAGPGLVYHEPNMIARPVGLPTVVTMNDLSWHHHPAWHPAERLAWIGRNLPATLRQADRFVAISAFTKAAVVDQFGIAAARIDVVPLAPAAEFRPVAASDAAPVLARYGLADRAYVFSISTVEPRKNFDRLLAAYLTLPDAAQARAPLVIAGGRGWGEALTRPDAQRAVRTGRLRMLGHVPDADLPVLCARAAVFAYVSLYEGFGLPVVEAMAAGAAVLASETTAVGELAAGAAVLVNPLDVDAMAVGLRALLEDAALAERMRAAGLARAGAYSWAGTVGLLERSWRLALG